MNTYRLKQVRNEQDLTQSTIANVLKVQRGTYASWECGTDLIPSKQLYNLANYYEKSTDYLLGLTNNNKKIICHEAINLEQIGKNLNYIRQNNKMSQAKFAETLNINQSTYWAYEKGKTLITTNTLIAIFQTYNYSIDWILNRDTKK